MSLIPGVNDCIRFFPFDLCRSNPVELRSGRKKLGFGHSIHDFGIAIPRTGIEHRHSGTGQLKCGMKHLEPGTTRPRLGIIPPKSGRTIPRFEIDHPKPGSEHLKPGTEHPNARFSHLPTLHVSPSDVSHFPTRHLRTFPRSHLSRSHVSPSDVFHFPMLCFPFRTFCSKSRTIPRFSDSF